MKKKKEIVNTQVFKPHMLFTYKAPIAVKLSNGEQFVEAFTESHGKPIIIKTKKNDNK